MWTIVHKQALGYVLAGALLSFVPLLGLAIVSMVVFMMRYDQSVGAEGLVIFGIVSAVSLGMLIWFLRGRREN